MENNNEYQDAMNNDVQGADMTPPEPQTPQDAKPVKEPPVKFDERQQRRVSELIRERQGHFAREARAEAARLKAENDALKLQVAAKSHENPAPVSDDVQRLSLRLAERDAEVAAMRSQQSEAQIMEELRQAAHAAGVQAVDPVFFRLLREQTKVENGKVVVSDTDDAMEPLSLKAHVEKFAASKPFLIRGQVSPGLGSTQATYNRPSKESQLETFFSNSAQQNIYVKTHGLAAYKQLVAQAAEYGIMPNGKRRTK